MNELPLNWVEQIRQAYPKRSGPSSWGSCKLMYAIRTALFESTWQEILDGIKRYKAYCDQAGRTGSEFVMLPLRFIADKCYQEDFGYQRPKTEAELASDGIRARDEKRMESAIKSGAELTPALRPYLQESVGAFETRVRLAADRFGRRLQMMAVK